jgi:hypothetical protein
VHDPIPQIPQADPRRQIADQADLLHPQEQVPKGL